MAGRRDGRNHCPDGRPGRSARRRARGRPRPPCGQPCRRPVEAFRRPALCRTATPRCGGGKTGRAGSDRSGLCQIDSARRYKRALFCDRDRKSTRLNSSHMSISYAVFCLKKKKKKKKKKKNKKNKIKKKIT